MSQINYYLKELAEKHNLKYSPLTSSKNGKVKGSLDKHKIMITVGFHKDNYHSKTSFEFRIKIIYKQPFPRKFSIRKNLLDESQKIQNNSNTIKSGHLIFDENLILESYNPLYLAAILSNDLRNSLLFMFKGNCILRLNHKYITYIYQRDNFNKVEFEEYLNEMTCILDSILSSKDTKLCLADNMINDPIRDVRMNCLKIFIDKYLHDSDSDKFLTKMLNDDDIIIQYKAAQYMGSTGMSHLTKMIKSSNQLDQELLQNIIYILGNNSYTKSIPLLKQLYYQKISIVISKEIIDAFAIFGKSELNDFLLEELHSSNDEISSSSLNALQYCGTLETIEKLYNYEISLLNPFEKKKVREVITKIQNRCSKGEAGMLSVTENSSEEGALSIANEAGEGALSKVKRKRKSNV